MINLLQSTVSHCYYVIQFLKSHFISIRIQNFDTKKLSRVLIDNSMLFQYEFTVNQLYQLMFRQFIYQNKVNKKLIKCQKTRIYITINIPNHPVRMYDFECQQVNLNDAELAMQMAERFTSQKINQIQQFAKQAASNICALVATKLKNCYEQIQKKKQQVDQKIAASFSQKMQVFQNFVNSIQLEYERKYQQCQKQAMQALSQHNIRLHKQLSVIERRLELQIQALNSNMHEEYAIRQDLQNQIKQQRDYCQTINQKLIATDDKFTSMIHQLYQSPNFKLEHRPELGKARKKELDQSYFQNDEVVISEQMMINQPSQAKLYENQQIEEASATIFINEQTSDKIGYQQGLNKRKNIH